jgi:hypothetical protein
VPVPFFALLTIAGTEVNTVDQAGMKITALELAGKPSQKFTSLPAAN